MEEQFEVLQFIKILGKRKAIIVLGTIICLLGSIVATSLMTPKFESSTRLLVSQGQIAPGNQSLGESYQALLLSERLAMTFKEMISSRTLAERVISKLELPLLPEDLQKKVGAKLVKDTQLIEISVTDDNPVQVKNIANAYASEFVTITKEVIPSSALINVKVVEPAVVPLDPVKPNATLNVILGFLIGLMASIGLAFLMETLDVTIKEQEDVEGLLGVPSLGKIPGGESPFLLSNDNAIVSDAYRSIRTNLQYINFNQSIKTLIVSSPNQSEGKTTVSANLAIVYAQAGYKVLIIECDLRRPTLANLFYIPDDRGLSNVLAGAATVESVMRETQVDGLQIISSGPIPPNPADLLNSEHMDRALADLREKFDLIILDSPPALAITDTAILSTKADAVLLLSHYGKTKKNEIVAAKEALSKVGARIIGFVINGANMPRKGGYYYYKSYAEQPTATN